MTMRGAAGIFFVLFMVVSSATGLRAQNTELLVRDPTREVPSPVCCITGSCQCEFKLSTFFQSSESFTFESQDLPFSAAPPFPNPVCCITGSCQCDLLQQSYSISSGESLQQFFSSPPPSPIGCITGSAQCEALRVQKVEGGQLSALAAESVSSEALASQSAAASEVSISDGGNQEITGSNCDPDSPPAGLTEVQKNTFRVACNFENTSIGRMCNEAAFYLYNKGSRGGLYRYLVQTNPSAEHRRMLEQYKSSCFVETASDEFPSQLLTRAANTTYAGRDFVRCSGVILDDDYEVFITARHCLPDGCPFGKQCIGASQNLELLPGRQVWSLTEDPEDTFRLSKFSSVEEVEEALGPGDWSDLDLEKLIGTEFYGNSDVAHDNWRVPTDKIVLRTNFTDPNRARAALSMLPIGRAEQGDRLMILGKNNHLVTLGLANADATNGISRVDLSDACQVLEAQTSCMFSLCQTEAGMSGAPVFAMRDDNWLLAGIHSGGVAPKTDISRAQCSAENRIGVENVSSSLFWPE
ncbi:trypsin-like serine peptidase [Shimia sp. MMG029]|uniref:trypsin-like serine peptidase n=1 Tax=Shimia sp. MMG029 TaxID=3021978 RepID=UPI0022FF0CE2|nr:hypothetical protein [Shimia sp. MMG029]MDA5558159.1 hypothetical protein [Shimia sp. MMG029]